MRDLAPSTDPHKAIRDDVRLLGELLGETLKRQEGPALFERVERVRALAKGRRAVGDSAGAGFETLAGELAAMPLEEAIPVARAFAHFLNLANVAEQHHRVRRSRAYQRDPSAGPQPASIAEALPRLVGDGVTPSDLHRAVSALAIELVVTAHPTEIMRRTLQQKYRRIAELLDEHDRSDLTPLERQEILDGLAREITAAWETEEIRRDRPSPLEEVRSAMTVFEETLWHAVPRYLRQLDATLRRVGAGSLPLDCAPVRFGSWIGGDRDGNPNVTPDVTWRACLMSRWTAASLYAQEIEALRGELSMSKADETLTARVGGAPEPYRALLRQVQQRLDATKVWIGEQLKTPGVSQERSALPACETPGVFDAASLAEPLMACYRSLHATGNGLIADGRLADVLRRIAVFGVTLVRLDVRQESRRHGDVFDAATRHLGLGSYAEWPEERRVEFLLDVLE